MTVIVLMIIVKILLVTVAVCFGIKIGYDRACKDVLAIIDEVTADYEDVPTEIDVGREKAVISFEKKDGMLAMASMIKVLVLALKGGEQG